MVHMRLNAHRFTGCAMDWGGMEASVLNEQHTKAPKEALESFPRIIASDIVPETYCPRIHRLSAAYSKDLFKFASHHNRIDR